MVMDYGLICTMEKIAISKFKATCLGVIERVRRTRKPIQITRFGKPMAEIVPASPEAPKKFPWGCMAGTFKIHGDIVGPISSEDDWEAGRG